MMDFSAKKRTSEACKSPFVVDCLFIGKLAERPLLNNKHKAKVHFSITKEA